jgi:hypothetical protein
MLVATAVAASAVAAAIVTMLRANPFIDCSLDVDADDSNPIGYRSL